MTDLRSTIESQLENFQTLELRPAALALLETLGYKSDKTMELDGSPAAFLELYFPEEAKEKDLQFMDQVAELLNVDDASSFVAHARPNTDFSAATSFSASRRVRVRTRPFAFSSSLSRRDGFDCFC